MWLLSVFIVSVIGASFIFFVKTNELKSGRKSFVGHLLSKGDPTIARISNYLKGLFHHHSERAFFLFLVHIPGRAEAFFRKLKSRAHDYYHDANTKIRNKRDFNEGSVSPYMRSMSLRRDGDVNRF